MEATVRQVVVDKLFGVPEGPENVPSWLADLAQLAAGSGQLAANGGVDWSRSRRVDLKGFSVPGEIDQPRSGPRSGAESA